MSYSSSLTDASSPGKASSSGNGSKSSSKSKSNAATPYPNERTAARLLWTSFRSANNEIIDELAYLVSNRRHTIDDAFEILQEMESGQLTKPKQPVVSSRVDPQPKMTRTPSSLTSHSPSTPGKRYNANQVPVDPVVPVIPAVPAVPVVPSASSNPRVSSVPMTPPQRYSVPPNGVIPLVFTTSMTGDRRVRDHCRQIGTLLYLKRVKYDEVNIADDPVLQQRMWDMYEASEGVQVNAIPSTPAVFMGNRYIGDYERLQDLEDEGILMDTLIQFGYNVPSNGEGDYRNYEQ